MKWIQKIVINGTSTVVTLPRELLFRLKARPGDFVELEHEDDADGYRVRLWRNLENGSRSSPRKITESPEIPR